MNSLLTTLPLLLPIAVTWVEKQEAVWLERGSPLEVAQMADARRAGVKEPERIRLIQVDALPQPENEEMLFVAKHIGFYSDRSFSLALGYAICLLADHWTDRPQLVHEFVHIAQYERMGGIHGFLSNSAFDFGNFPHENWQLVVFCAQIWADLTRVAAPLQG